MLQTGHHHHHLPATKDGHIRTPFMPLPHNLRSPPNINACSHKWKSWQQECHTLIEVRMCTTASEHKEKMMMKRLDPHIKMDASTLAKSARVALQILPNPVPSKGFEQYNILVSITINAPKSQNSQVSIELCISKTLEMFVLTN